MNNGEGSRVVQRSDRRRGQRDDRNKLCGWIDLLGILALTLSEVGSNCGVK